VVGYDDIFGLDFCHPPLTTIAAPIDQAGRTLIYLLLGVRDVQRVPLIVLPTVLGPGVFERCGQRPWMADG
jgi:DNA-binding LacI/PurR family transcriptional regulator